MASGASERETNIETIPHLTPRDPTVMVLESILLGRHAAGLRNVLAITGDTPDYGDYPGSQGVYEVDAIGLCKIMQKLNSGESYAGKSLDAPTTFFYGVAVNPTADDVDEELRRFEQKIEGGAQFAITQSQFDLEHFDRFEQLLGGWPIPVLLGVFYVTSYPLALRLHNEVPGMKVAEHVRERFRAAGADAMAVGLEVARELVAEAQGRVAGIEVIAPFKAPLAALEVLPQPAAQAPVETGARAAESSARSTGAPGTRRGAGRMGAWWSPAASIAGPPESPCSIAPATAVMRRSTGPRPYASCVSAIVVSPIRPGVDRSGPFSG